MWGPGNVRMDGAPFQLSNFEWMKLLDILIWGMRKPTYIGKHGGSYLRRLWGILGGQNIIWCPAQTFK
jgi:hypothetical protein